MVREIEGDLSELQWTGRYLPRPVFVPKVRACGHRRGRRVGWGLGCSWGERGLEGGRPGCCSRCAAPGTISVSPVLYFYLRKVIITEPRLWLVPYCHQVPGCRFKRPACSCRPRLLAPTSAIPSKIRPAPVVAECCYLMPLLPLEERPFKNLRCPTRACQYQGRIAGSSRCLAGTEPWPAAQPLSDLSVSLYVCLFSLSHVAPLEFTARKVFSCTRVCTE